MKKIFAACALALTTLMTIPAVADEALRRPLDYSALVGVWNNTNPATRSIVRVIVRRVPSGITIQAFGACTPTPCNHGIVHARAFSPGVSSASAIGFDARKQFSFKTTDYEGFRYPNGQLGLLTQDRFRGGDLRFDYSVLETFVRVAADDQPVDRSDESRDRSTAADEP